MVNKLKNLNNRVFRVLEQNIYVFKTGYETIGSKVFLPIFFGSIGICFQILAIALLFTFLKSNNIPQQFEKILLFFNIDLLNLHLQTASMWLSFFIFTLLGISAVANYFFQKLTVKYSGLAEATLIEKLIDKSQSVKLFITPKINGLSCKDSVIRTITSDMRSVNRVLQVAITGIIPLITLVLSLSVIFYLNWKVSLLLTPAAFFYSFALFKINAKAIASSHLFDITAIKTRRSVASSILKSTKSRLDINSYIDSYNQLLLIPHKSSFINDFTIAILLSVVFFGVTHKSNLDRVYLAEMGLYLVALRYSIVCLKQVSTKLSIMNRFYPQTSRVRQLSNFLFTARKPYLKDPKEIILKNSVTSMIRGKAYLVRNTHAIDRYSILNVINNLTNLKSYPNYRSIAILSKDILLNSDQCADSAEFKDLFLKIANDASTNWIFVDKWSLDKQGLTIELLEKQFPQKFILFSSEPKLSDAQQQRYLIEMQDDIFVNVFLITSALININPEPKSQHLVNDENDNMCDEI